MYLELKWIQRKSEKRISHISSTIFEAKSFYAHIEKEKLVLVFALKKLHHYFHGNCFTPCYDHKPLLELFAEDKHIPSLTGVSEQR